MLHVLILCEILKNYKDVLNKEMLIDINKLHQTFSHKSVKVEKMIFLSKRGFAFLFFCYFDLVSKKACIVACLSQFLTLQAESRATTASKGLLRIRVAKTGFLKIVLL